MLPNVAARKAAALQPVAPSPAPIKAGPPTPATIDATKKGWAPKAKVAVPTTRALAQATVQSPAKGAAALRAELERIPDPTARQLFAMSAREHVQAISKEVNRSNGRPNEKDLQSILRDLSVASKLAGPVGADSIAGAFAKEMVDNHLDLDDEDQFGGALKKVIKEGAGAELGLRLPKQLRAINRAPEAQQEIAKAVGQALKGRAGSPEQTRAQVEALTQCSKVEVGEVALAHAPTQSERPELLIDGTQVFPRILQDLRGATDSIHITQYGFKESKIGREIADVLMAKAKAGVDVRVMVDQAGTQPHRANKKLFEDLAAAGVQVVTNDSASLHDQDGREGLKKKLDLTSDELGALDHRKLYVIDGKTAYTGGMGIEDNFVTKQHDVMVRMQGESVHQLQSTFLSGFMLLGGKVPKDPVALAQLYPKPDAPKHPVKTTVLNNVPKADFFPITKAYHQQIAQAQKSITIMNPYFGDDDIANALAGAAKRGVKVTLMVPKSAENFLNDGSQKGEYKKLLNAGVEVREYPTMMHGKVMITDGEKVLVGTANLDKFSLKKNWELNMQFDDAKVAREFEQRIFANDRPLTTPGKAPGNSLRERAKAWLGDLVMG